MSALEDDLDQWYLDYAEAIIPFEFASFMEERTVSDDERWENPDPTYETTDDPNFYFGSELEQSENKSKTYEDRFKYRYSETTLRSNIIASLREKRQLLDKTEKTVLQHKRILKFISQWERKTGMIFRYSCFEIFDDHRSYISLPTSYQKIRTTFPIMVTTAASDLEQLPTQIAEVFNEHFSKLDGTYPSVEFFEHHVLHPFNCLIHQKWNSLRMHNEGCLGCQVKIQNGHLSFEIRWFGDNGDLDTNLPSSMGTVVILGEIPKIGLQKDVPIEMIRELFDLLRTLNFDGPSILKVKFASH